MCPSLAGHLTEARDCGNSCAITRREWETLPQPARAQAANAFVYGTGGSASPETTVKSIVKRDGAGVWPAHRLADCLTSFPRSARGILNQHFDKVAALMLLFELVFCT